MMFLGSAYCVACSFHDCFTNPGGIKTDFHVIDNLMPILLFGAAKKTLSCCVPPVLLSARRLQGRRCRMKGLGWS